MFYDIFIGLCNEKAVRPAQVARDLKINQSTVSMWKSQGTTPNAETLAALSEYFDVPMDYLLGRPPFNDLDLIKNFKGVILNNLTQFEAVDKYMEKQTVGDMPDRIYLKILNSYVHEITLDEKRQSISLNYKSSPSSVEFMNAYGSTSDRAALNVMRLFNTDDSFIEKAAKAAAYYVEREYKSKGYSFSDIETQMISFFSRLNEMGQAKAMESVEIIAGNPDYQKKEDTLVEKEAPDAET